MKNAEREFFTREPQKSASERGFRALAEAAPVILWTADADGAVNWFNRRWYEYTGLTSEEASGWGWQVVHHPEDFPEVMRRWPASIASGEPFEMEFRIRGADGLFHWFLTRAQPLRDEDGTILRWYGSNIDIDAQIRERDRSIRIAQTLQQVFLPKRLPHDSTVRFDAVYRPAEKDSLVGGDWYDAFELKDGRIAFSIGDVGGHGLNASVVAGSVRQAIFTLSFLVDDPADLLRQINRIVCYQSPDTLVTALVGFIDRDRRVLRYANAGHPAPIVTCLDGETVELPFGTMPLGVYGELANVETTALPLDEGMVVALYTDGLIEAGRDIFAGERTLRKLVSNFVGDVTSAKPAEMILRDALRLTPPFDDAALMLIQFSKVPQMLIHRVADRSLQKVWRFHSSDAYSAHNSRQELTAYLTAFAIDPGDTFIAELILGEILANTVRHAPGLVEINIDWTGEMPVVSVRDMGPGLEELGSNLPQDVFEEKGRGMYLIRTLAENVTVCASSGFGVELRATLPVKRRIGGTF